VTRSAKAPPPEFGIRLADSVTALDARHRNCVLVAGSHGGIVAARYAAAAGVRAAIFNDAGGGLDEAGFAGLAWLDAAGIAAATVAHTSARIADADDSYAHGVISHANAAARACGVRAGMSCRDAAALLRDAPSVPPIPYDHEKSRAILRTASGSWPEVRGLDSIGEARADDAGCFLVVGSHGGLHGGRPETALSVAAAAAVFHDAGRGKDDAGCTRLPVLAARGIPAATVDGATARIGDARSLWETGVLSCVNEAASLRGWRVGMRTTEAADLARTAVDSLPAG
jgi:hypothetical protein